MIVQNIYVCHICEFFSVCSISGRKHPKPSGSGHRGGGLLFLLYIQMNCSRVFFIENPE